jgi:hypothetical protein
VRVENVAEQQLGSCIDDVNAHAKERERSTSDAQRPTLQQKLARFSLPESVGGRATPSSDV